MARKCSQADGGRPVCEMDVEEVDVGDILLVKTGAKVPVDGRVLVGEASIKKRVLRRVHLWPRRGSRLAGTILDNGTVQIVADRRRGYHLWTNYRTCGGSPGLQSEAEHFIDHFSKYYTPAVLVLSFLVWLFSRHLELAITILVLGCPGALVIRYRLQCGWNRKRSTPWCAAQGSEVIEISVELIPWSSIRPVH